MAIVVETVNRRGRVLNSHYFAKNSITIGRSFDNDFVIDDHYVDPCHLEINVSDGQYICTDKNSINGLSSRKRKPLASPHTLADGDEVIIGKTLLRIGSKRTPTAPAVKLAFVESVGEFLASIPVVIISFLILLCSAYYDIKLSAFSLGDQTYAAMLTVVLSIVLMSSLFAFLGRVLKHDGRFLLYFSLINCIAILFYLYDFINPIVLFNLNIVQIDNIVDDFAYVSLFCLLLYVGLRFATRLRTKKLVMITSLLPALLLVDVLIPDTEAPFFDFYAPPYSPLVHHHSLYWGERNSHEQFQLSTQELYLVNDE